MSVVPQVKRVQNLLRLIDRRGNALRRSVDITPTHGNDSTEIEKLAKTSQLLTGGPTDRIERLGDLTDDELRQRLDKLRESSESTPSE